MPGEPESTLTIWSLRFLAVILSETGEAGPASGPPKEARRN